MNAITFGVNRKNGDSIKANVGPANRSEETRLGPADFVIIAIFLVCCGGLIGLLLLR